MALQAIDDSAQVLAKEISRRLAKKQDRFRGRYRLPVADWAATVKCSPSSIEAYLEAQDFSILLKRDIDIAFYYGKVRMNIWSKLDGPVSAKAYKDRLLILNPYAKSPYELQSWSRPVSISRIRPDHLAKYGNPHKSKYLASVAVDMLEIQIFNSAAAQVMDARTIHFYGRFSEMVGELKNGSLTKHVRLECTREPRKTGSGFHAQLHSYPIGIDDIGASALPLLRQQLEGEAQFKVPGVA